MIEGNLHKGKNTSWLSSYVFGGPSSLKTLDIQKIRELYRVAEYHSTFTVIGTLEEKLAQYPISNIVVPLKEKEREKVEDIMKKIRLKEKLVKAGIYMQRYGIAFVFPMAKTRKFLVCRTCGTKTALDLLYKNGKKLYKWNNFKFESQCRNTNCPEHAKFKEFSTYDQVSELVADMDIAVWRPHQMIPIENEITDKTIWQYKLPAATKKHIKEGEHYILCYTPQIFIDAAKETESVITLSQDKLFVMTKSPDSVGGLPIPPVIRALRSLMMKNAYDSANKTISEEMLVPLRMLFPVERGIGRSPMQQTVPNKDFVAKIRSELARFDKDKSHIPIMPVEVASKDYWGAGKLLVLHDHLRANEQDILAAMGVPLEFLYGGVTWSRQNISAMMLQNKFAVDCEMKQEFLDFIAERIKITSRMTDCVIRIIPPRLVESMGELGYIREGKMQGEVSNQTYYKQFHIDYNDELRKIEEEKNSQKKVAEFRGELEGETQVAMQRKVQDYQRTLRADERKEQLKDSLAMQAIEAQQMKRNIDAQKDMAMFQYDMQSKQMKDQVKDQIKMMRKQMKLQAEGMKQEYLAQHEAEKMMQEIQEDEDRVRYLEMAQEMVTPDVELELQQMPPEEQEDYLIQMAQQAEVDQFGETLPLHTKDRLAELGEEERMSELMRLFQEYMRTEQLAQSDPKALKDIMEKEKEEEDNHIRMKKLINMYVSAPNSMVWSKLEEKDPELVADVKAGASKIIVDKYSDMLINVPKEKEAVIMQKVKTRYPDLAHAIEEESYEKVRTKVQAMNYARKLFQMSDDQQLMDQSIEEITANAPEEFRELLLGYLEEFMMAEAVSKHQEASQAAYELAQKQIHDKNFREIARSIARSLMGLPDTDRKEHLMALKTDNPEMYRLIKNIITEYMMDAEE